VSPRRISDPLCSQLSDSQMQLHADESSSPWNSVLPPAAGSSASLPPRSTVTTAVQMHPQAQLTAEPTGGMERLAEARDHGRPDTDSAAVDFLSSDEHYWRLPAAQRDYITAAELEQQQQLAVIRNARTLAADLPGYSTKSTPNIRLS